ncbi:hypothetical protein [Microvirga lotononidis]|uniref:Uncharacterized protein n=1 Tax=Microvirga lotononidis TaxID=864069 RepID=I4YS42_9HYPH|nr:hypothetical protein [Microvirga lotononidis]EIM26784.1 hypothetical protein MicloDRAFT_00033340 [Microvirga lotononidis]WQO31690.1 hypothetical protein U0023_30440 [Microvirga lotononidis]
MTGKRERSPFRSEPHLPRMYSPEVGPLLQSLLVTLADLDFAHQSDIETVRNSSAEDWLKHSTIHRLQQLHRERREPYVRQLEAVQKRIRAMAA